MRLRLLELYKISESGVEDGGYRGQMNDTV